jgi:hypothetical protein
MVTGLTVAGWHRFLPQALQKGAGSGVAVQKTRDGIGCRLAGDRVRELGPQKHEQVLRRPHGKPFDRVRQDVGALASGELKCHRQRPWVGEAIVHVWIPTLIGEANDSWDCLALQVRCPAHAARLWRTAKRARADKALGVNGTEPGMRPGKRPHGLDELCNHRA